MGYSLLVPLDGMIVRFFQKIYSELTDVRTDICILGSVWSSRGQKHPTTRMI